MVSQTFDSWLSEMTARVEKIDSTGVQGDAKKSLVDKALEPYGLWKKNESPKESANSEPPATDKQIALLKKRHVYFDANITKTEASKLIDEALKQR